MFFQPSVPSERFRSIASATLVLLAFLASGWIGWQLGGLDNTAFLRFAPIALTYLLVFRAVWRWPHWGLILIAASLPLLDVLPDIPLATSVVQTIGGVTLLAYVKQNRGHLRVFGGLSPQHVFAGLFAVWQFISFPILSFDPSNQIWPLTYLQLWIVLWLTGEMMSVSHQRTLMKVYVAAAAISAIFAISQGYIGEEFRRSYKAIGLVGNSNLLAGYLVAALVFALLLDSQNRRRFSSPVFFGLALLLFLGILYSLSRTGNLALLVGLMLLGSFAKAFGGGARRSIAMMLTIVLILLVFAHASGYLQVLSTSIKAEAFDFTDKSSAIGARVMRWQYGLALWSDHPIQGIGTNMFRFSNPWRTVPHNMYVTVLVENGFVGLILFVCWLASVLIALVRVVRSKDVMARSFATAWTVILLTILFRGMTASIQADKLLWMIGGMSVALAHPPHVLKQGNIADG